LSKIACVAIVKNEERHIAEWLAWQFLIGFDTVLLLDNVSTDRTKEVARGLSPRHDVRIIDWPTGVEDFQNKAYGFAARLLAGEFVWTAFFDTDEFLVLDEGLDLKTCLAARPEPAIAVSWAMFGSSGHRQMPDGLVIENFRYRSSPEFAPNKHVKSIVRPERVRRALNAHAFEVDGDYADIKGKPVIWEFPGYLAAAPDYSGARHNHYFTRSWAHWLEKVARGFPGAGRTEQEFFEYDRNEIFDGRAAEHAPEIKALLEAGCARNLPITKTTGLTARSTAECSEQVDLAALASRGCANVVFHGPASTPLGAPDIRGSSGPVPPFCGPFMFLPEIGAYPENFPTVSLSPPLRLSRMENVLYLPGQVAIIADGPMNDGAMNLERHSVILTESFNSDWDRGTHHSIRRDGPDAFSLIKAPEKATVKPGRYLFLDNQHRGHFGHILTDVVSLAWAYHAFVMLGLTDIQVLVYDAGSPLPRGLLSAAGIPEERLVSFNEAVLLEEVLFATKSYLTQGYTSPLALETFRQIRDFFDNLPADAGLPEQIYLSRKNISGRKLVNEDAAIAMFAARGFAVIEPEMFSIADQVRIAANARMIAGASGSNMFHLAFQKNLQKAFILVSPNLFHFSELFLNAGHAARLTYYIGEALGPDVHSNWKIDPVSLEAEIDLWLGGAQVSESPCGPVMEQDVVRGAARPAPDLVFEIGMSEGNDTAFYLAKGFRVIGVEPDVKRFYALNERFGPEIEAGRLCLENFVPGERHGEIVEFFPAGDAKAYHAVTVGWSALVEKYGVPHYARLSREARRFFSNAGPARPANVSVPAEDAEALSEIGYRHFKLVPRSALSERALFGPDLPSEWVDFEIFRSLRKGAQRAYAHIRFDCHAWMPEFG
jgi:capsular polysaccharide biosynthesis protein